MSCQLWLCWNFSFSFRFNLVSIVVIALDTTAQRRLFLDCLMIRKPAKCANLQGRGSASTPYIIPRLGRKIEAT
jgi:hypothetical protein